MTSPAILARLNPANVRFDVGRGGIPELTQTDIAAACQGLVPGAWYLGLVKYAGAVGAVKNLEIAAWMLAADLAAKHEWKVVRGKPYLRSIARMACATVIDPHRCKKCCGTGLNERMRACSICAGSGVITEISLRSLAKIAEIPVESFRTVWAPRYELLVSHIQLWDSSLESLLKRRLKG